MKRGDTVWVPWTRWLDGEWQWYPRRWTWMHTSNDRAELSDAAGGGQCDPDDLYATREACEAAIALRAASEAVAKARDAAVDAARAFVRRGHGPLAESVVVLEELERAEADARARLEALRSRDEREWWWAQAAHHMHEAGNFADRALTSRAYRRKLYRDAEWAKKRAELSVALALHALLEALR